MICITKKSGKVFTLCNIINTLAWLLVFGVSIYALVQSDKSLVQSNESNNIARQALVVSQRPYITFKSVKFRDTDSFILAKEVKNGIEIKVQFELENLGNSMAKNIKPADIFCTSQEIFHTDPEVVEKITMKAQLPGVISLAPGESIFMEFVGQIPVLDKRAVIDQLEKIKNNEFSLPFNLEIYYDTDFLPTIKGKTASSMVIKPNEVETIYIDVD